eukprot:COSAG02_NODE_6878_length_3312_cov_12.371304_2_plen_69_part_00
MKVVALCPELTPTIVARSEAYRLTHSATMSRHHRLKTRPHRPKRTLPTQLRRYCTTALKPSTIPRVLR